MNFSVKFLRGFAWPWERWAQEKTEREIISEGIDAAYKLAQDEIEKWFMQGCTAAMRAGATLDPEIPYEKDTTARHWFTRGYAYMARLKRAFEAEAEATALRVRLIEAQGQIERLKGEK